MSANSPATTTLPSVLPPTIFIPQSEQHLPLSPPHSPDDSNNLPLHDRYKIHDQIYQHTSPTDSCAQPPAFPTSFPASADLYSRTAGSAPPAPSTPDTIRVKSEICSPPISLRPSPSPADSSTQALERPPTPTDLPLGEHCQLSNTQIGSSPTTRALRSLGLTRADLAQHAQRMKSFLVAGGRRGFPSAADLANADVKSEATDSDLLLTQSSTSSIRRQASVVSYTSSVCTTATTTGTSRASSAYPTGPSTNTSVDMSSQERRAPRGRTALPPLPPSSPPEMFSPVGGSGESNRTGINSSPIRSPLASPARAGPSRAYAATEYQTNSDVPYTIPSGPRTTEKPSASYAALIGQAIMSAIPDSNGKKKLTLAHIYAWISTAWPYYKPGEAGWMNSIRHNLSLNDCFIKIKRDGREKGKGSFWSIREGDEDMFANGGFVRRNSAAKKRKKDTTPTRDEPEARPSDPSKKFKSNPAPTNYVYEPPQYPPLPNVSRAAHPHAPVTQPAAKRSRVTAPAPAPANQKSYRSPVGDQIPSSSPSRVDSGKRGYAHDYEGLPPELTPNMSSSPDMPDSSPISSSPPPPVRPAAREAPADYPKKSGLMDMIINNSSKKRRVSGGATTHARISTLDNGSPVMKRRPNAEAEEHKTIYPASMLARPGSPTRHINPRAIIKAKSDQQPSASKASTSYSARTQDSGASSSRRSEPITPPHGSDQSGLPSGSERSGLLVAKPSDIIPSTPPRTLVPLTMATSAERTPLSHAALHMSPSRPSDLSHFKNSVHPPSASYRDSPSHPMEFRTPLGRQTGRISSLSGSILGISGESPMLRTPLGYGGIRDINDLNSGCAEELMASPTARELITASHTDDQSPSFLFGRMYRSPEGTWGPRPDW